MRPEEKAPALHGKGHQRSFEGWRGAFSGKDQICEKKDGRGTPNYGQELLIFCAEVKFQKCDISNFLGKKSFLNDPFPNIAPFSQSSTDNLIVSGS